MKLAVLLYCLLAIGDALTTYLGFARGLQEANPLMLWVLVNLGPVAFYGLRVLFPVIVITYLLDRVRRRWSQRHVWALMACPLVVTSLAVAYNLALVVS